MRLEHIVTMDLGKINYEDGTWVATVQDHAQWQYLTLELLNGGSSTSEPVKFIGAIQCMMIQPGS
jgi:hypothetical protein